MNALKTILSRRNVRTFKPTAVPEHLVTELLQAAMAAPQREISNHGTLWSSLPGKPSTSSPSFTHIHTC